MIQPIVASEDELRSRFDVRTEPFSHAGVELDILLPRAADPLIDADAFERDERLPYWADLWPSARGLARHLIERSIPTGSSVLELGCGLGLPALVTAARGFETLATDYEVDALRFTATNAQRNRIADLQVDIMDWRVPTNARPVDLVIGADLLYEHRNSIALAELLPVLLRPGGLGLLADPGRAYQFDFRNRIEARGWAFRQIDERLEISDPATGVCSRIGIFVIEQA